MAGYGPKGGSSGYLTAKGITDHGALGGLADHDHTQYGPLATANTWTAAQNSGGTTLTSSSNEIDIDSSANNVFYHNITETSEVQNPTNLAAYKRFTIIIEADGTNELTWDTYYDWGESDAPDFSAMTDGEFLVCEFIAKSTTVIACAASEIYGS